MEGEKGRSGEAEKGRVLIVETSWGEINDVLTLMIPEVST
jgi:hypothetical protein